MIKKKQTNPQKSFWISTEELQVKPQLTFYKKLDELLAKIEFGKQVREFCQSYYSPKSNCRPPIDPEAYFKMLIVGFFEGIASERAIASRCADSLSIRAFLHYDISEATPEHSSMTVIRQRLPEGVFSQVFSKVLAAMKQYGMVKGKNLSLDSSIIESNASLKSLVNRMTEESYAEYIKSLAQQAGVNPEDHAAVARFDRKREGRKTSNEEWFNPNDPDAKIGKTKDGASDMIYKPEHIVDLDTGAIVDATIIEGDKGDTHQLTERIIEAQIRLNDIAEDPAQAAPIESITADKFYYNTDELVSIQSIGIATVIPDKDYERNMDKLDDEQHLAVELAKSEVKSKQGKSLLKKRGMYVERSFAHVLDCGAYRRTTMRGRGNIQKRYYIATACFNISLLMRAIYGFGTLKQLLCTSKTFFIFIINQTLLINRAFFEFRFNMFLFNYVKERLLVKCYQNQY